MHLGPKDQRLSFMTETFLVPFVSGLDVLVLFQRPFEVGGQTSFYLHLFDYAAFPPQPCASPWSLTTFL